MYSSFERIWVSIQDSSRFRHFVKRGLGARFFKSDIYHQIYLAKNYVTSAVVARRQAAVVKNVNTFCLFIGHNKSGTSMLGALLDAHPNIILADEVDALKYVNGRFSRSQIFHLLLRASRRERLKGRVTARRLGAYSWLVPNQWQGKYQTLRVLGDSTSGSSTRRLGQDPQLLPQLEAKMGPVQVKIILVIRNPFDPISFIMLRGKRSFENAIDHYFSNCQMVEALLQQINSEHVLPVRYEQFIGDPRSQLTAVCQFLGVQADDDYLEACTSILYAEPEQGRHLVPWDEKWISLVEENIKRYEFLQGYSFSTE